MSPVSSGADVEMQGSRLSETCCSSLLTSCKVLVGCEAHNARSPRLLSCCQPRCTRLHLLAVSPLSSGADVEMKRSCLLLQAGEREGVQAYRAGPASPASAGLTKGRPNMTVVCSTACTVLHRLVRGFGLRKGLWLQELHCAVQNSLLHKPCAQ